MGSAIFENHTRRAFIKRFLVSATVAMPVGLLTLRRFPVRLTFRIDLPAGHSADDYMQNMSQWIDKTRLVAGVEALKRQGVVKGAGLVESIPGSHLIYGYDLSSPAGLNRLRDLAWGCDFNPERRRALGYSTDIQVSILPVSSPLV